MDVINIENKRSKLNDLLSSSSSPRERVLITAEYFDSLIASNDNNIIESYAIEFIEPFIASLYYYNPSGINPALTGKLIDICEKLSGFDCIIPFKERLNSALDRIKYELSVLKQSLNGIKNRTTTNGRFYIPVIEETTEESGLKLGLLESISVSLKKSKDKGKFVIVPSGKELEQRLIEQVKTSWNVALNEAKKYLKKRSIDELDVIINFDKRYGYYTGDSLGTALTVLFLEEILNYYNSPIVISKNSIAALTGGIDEEGNVKPVSNEIIKQKTGIVFFSDAGLFVVPKQDEQTAENELSLLKRKYPGRQLKIESIKSFDDLLNRRNAIDIKKQKVVVRGAKYLKKHWVNTAVTLLLTLALAVLFILDFDNNPATLEQSGRLILVKNKNGKVLWRNKFYDKEPVFDYFGDLLERIEDVNNDGKNEVLIVDQNNNSENSGALVCFNYKGDTLWVFQFGDSIRTNYERFEILSYGIRMVGFDYFNNRKTLYLTAQLTPYFPTAVFRLDAATGNRLPGTYWNPGGITNGTLVDINNDGTKELVLLGINNEFNCVTFFAMNKDSLYGRGPAIYRYVFPGKKPYKFIHFFMIPNSDYNNFMNMRYPLTYINDFNYTEKTKNFKFSVFQGPISDNLTVNYRVGHNFKIKDIVIPDQFRVARDSLVARGFLSPPYTDTKEYVKILKDQIRYWDGEKFVTAEEYFGRN